jgi:hypothetical protein
MNDNYLYEVVGALFKDNAGNFPVLFQLINITIIASLSNSKSTKLRDEIVA